MGSPCTGTTREASPQSSTRSEDGGDIPYDEDKPLLSTKLLPNVSLRTPTVRQPDPCLESSHDETGEEAVSSNYPESTATRAIIKSSDEKNNGFRLLKEHYDKGMSWEEIRKTYAERFKIWRSADSLKRWHGQVLRDSVLQIFSVFLEPTLIHTFIPV